MKKTILFLFILFTFSTLQAAENIFSINFGWSPMTGNIGFDYRFNNEFGGNIGWSLHDESFGLGITRFFKERYEYGGNKSSSFIRIGINSTNQKSNAVFLIGRQTIYNDKHNINPTLKYGVGLTTNRLPVFELMLGIPLIIN